MYPPTSVIHIYISHHLCFPSQPIAAIRHLPGAQCLAVLCDSVLLLLHVETLDGSRAPGLLGITAMSAEGAPATQPPVLALATKPSKKVVLCWGWRGRAMLGSRALSHYYLCSFVCVYVAR